MSTPLTAWSRMRNYFFTAALLTSVIGFAKFARADDDTDRFKGIWTTTESNHGNTTEIAAVHNGASLKCYVIVDNASLPLSEGTFSAADGRYTIRGVYNNDVGSYRIIDDSTIACVNAIGQTTVWTRDILPLPPFSELKTAT